MRRENLPIAALVSGVVLLISAMTLLVTVDVERQTTPAFVTILGLLVTSIPSLFAAAFAERAARDIRNGVVRESVKEATAQVIDEKKVLTREGPIAQEIHDIKETVHRRDHDNG